MAYREGRRGKVALLVPAAVREESGPASEPGQGQGNHRKKVSLDGFAVDPDVHSAPLPDRPGDLCHKVPTILHVDIIGTLDLAVLVEVHDPAVPAARLQFFAQPHQAHRPTAHGRGPVADLENALGRRTRCTRETHP